VKDALKGGVGATIHTARVVHEDGRRTRQHIARVHVIYGEVVGGGYSFGAGVETYYADEAAVGG
jgi:hypothetical protein